jgi:hypothetical protein
MASAVATPLERQFGRIAGITEMTSTSGLGSTNITIQFDLNRNIDAAARDVQAAINAARGQLPANLPNNPSYRKVNPADAPIMILSLTSTLVERARMYDIGSSILQQKLAQVEGVGQVFVGGGALPAVRVDVNPTALYNNGLGLEDVRAALAAANANRPKGEIADSQRSMAIATTDQLLTAAEYRPLIIHYSNGAGVRLSDVATVTDSVEDIRTGGLSNGKPAVLIIVFRQPGANIIQTVDRVRALLPQLQASIPPSIALSVAIDATRTIRASVRDVQITLVISIVLVILVVFVFLRNVRSTFIPSVAVASLAHRHLRRHVSAGLLDRQPLAHGPDDRDRLRRGRRDRRHREHHKAHRRGDAAARGRVEGGAGDRLHGHLDLRFANLGLHTHPAHGRNRRASLPGICRHPFRRHHRLARDLPDRDADDVRPAPPPEEQDLPRPSLPGERERLQHDPARVRAVARMGLETPAVHPDGHPGDHGATIFLYAKVPKSFPRNKTGRFGRHPG